MAERKAGRSTLVSILWILAVSLAAGLVFQILLQAGEFWKGFLASSFLVFISAMVLYLAWRAAGKGQALAWMILLAFFLRFVLGIFLAWGLPRFGYPERPQEAGFVFEDAFRREENAWNLAKSGDPLIRAFSDDYETDQYGGMLALSALVYRTLSPDAYRPALIPIMAAGAMALSLPIFISALRRRFSEKAVLLGGWILALYPEGVLLGSTQMREPFIILIFTLMIWAVIHLLDRKKLRWAIPVLVLGGFSLFLLSFRITLPLLGFLLLWIWVDLSARLKLSWMKLAGWALILAAVAGGLWFLRDWVDAVLHWDTLQTVRRSGMVQAVLDALPDWAQFPFILVYGIFQPVLPAAIASPAPWIWRALGIYRALGWYALLPLLAYAAVRVWRLDPSRKKRWLVLMILMAWAWILIASARAGGDQWDNPRYRTIFLPGMALIGGWAIQFARKARDTWLSRTLMIEGIFLVVFTFWYLGRYSPEIPRPGFGVMVAIIAVLSSLVIGLGWLRDRKRPIQDSSISDETG